MTPAEFCSDARARGFSGSRTAYGPQVWTRGYARSIAAIIWVYTAEAYKSYPGL